MYHDINRYVNLCVDKKRSKIENWLFTECPNKIVLYVLFGFCLQVINDTCWLNFRYVIVVYQHKSILRRATLLFIVFVINLFSNNKPFVLPTETIIYPIQWANCLFSKICDYLLFRRSIFGHFKADISLRINASKTCPMPVCY